MAKNFLDRLSWGGLFNHMAKRTMGVPIDDEERAQQRRSRWHTNGSSRWGSSSSRWHGADDDDQQVMNLGDGMEGDIDDLAAAAYGCATSFNNAQDLYHILKDYGFRKKMEEVFDELQCLNDTFLSDGKSVLVMPYYNAQVERDVRVLDRHSKSLSNAQIEQVIQSMENRTEYRVQAVAPIFKFEVDHYDIVTLIDETGSLTCVNGWRLLYLCEMLHDPATTEIFVGDTHGANGIYRICPISLRDVAERGDSGIIALLAPHKVDV